MTVDDFARFSPYDWDLTVGSVIGTRSFCWNGTNLTGVTHKLPWVDGENTAVCDNRPILMCTGNNPACSCGFYAYWDGSDDYADMYGTISGIIEGYGKTVVGTRGFRCGKAKILALLLPEFKSNNKTECNREELQEEYMSGIPWALRHHLKRKNENPDYIGAGVGTPAAVLGLVAGPIAVLQGLTSGPLYVAFIGIVLLLLGVFGIIYEKASFDMIHVWYSDEYRRLFRPNARLTLAEDRLNTALQKLYTGVTEQDVESIKKTYPDVQIFHDRDEMMKAFPTGEK